MFKRTRSMSSMVKIILLYCQMFPLFVLSNTDSARHVILPSFSWDPRNDCFNATKERKYARMKVDQESQIYFICPSIAITYDLQTYYTPKKNMYENMYMCTKDEFDECRVGPKRTEQTRLVMKCDDPLDTQKLKYTNFIFGQFKSSQDGYAFKANKTYYFIATSNGTQGSLDNRKDGRCKANNMRLAITICELGNNCHLGNTRCNKGQDVIKTSPKRKDMTFSVNTDHQPLNKDVPDKSPSIPSDHVSDPLPPPAQRASRQDESSFSEVHVIYISTAAGLAGIVIGILLAIVYRSLQKRRSQGGAYLSAYCCDNRSKIRNEVNKRPLC